MGMREGALTVELRRYQLSAVAGVRASWGKVESVLLVAPTGAGKTVLGEELISDLDRVLWVAHRRELVAQTVRRLRHRFGSASVGVIMPGEPATTGARVQVGTVQTLLARRTLPDVGCIVLDEAHHYVAEDWRRLLETCGHTRCLGLTATPQRADGEALGDIFEDLVVAASYSELLADGFLVHARVFRPLEPLGSDLAQDPLEAWLKNSGGAQTFVFCARVEAAKILAQRFRDHGIIAETIEADTPARERDGIMSRFRSGRTRVLTNVNVLTEGVDVPEAGCVVLAKPFGHVSGMLQAAGRVLRPSPGKTMATIIDLTGSTLQHGLPTDDRSYSLNGRAISTLEHSGGEGSSVVFTQEIQGVNLHMVSSLPDPAPLPIEAVAIDDSERRAEYQRLLTIARVHRMRDGFAAVKYREKYGEEPRRGWA
jgi:superfamily II DNA or RNA helicase